MCINKNFKNVVSRNGPFVHRKGLLWAFFTQKRFTLRRKWLKIVPKKFTLSLFLAEKVYFGHIFGQNW